MEQETKKCNRCEQEKELAAFSKKRDKLQPFCKECNKLYLKEHYEKNKAYYKEKRTRWRNGRKKENKEKVIEYLADKECVDCGDTRWQVLHFDHVDEKLKAFNISQKICEYKWETIKKEIEKCEIRCANCHLIRTADQFGWYQYLDE